MKFVLKQELQNKPDKEWRVFATIALGDSIASEQIQRFGGMPFLWLSSLYFFYF